jgi:hypothetical protein
VRDQGARLQAMPSLLAAQAAGAHLGMWYSVTMMRGKDLSQSVTVEVTGSTTIAEVYTRAYGLPEDAGVHCYATMAGVLQGSDVVASMGLMGSPTSQEWAEQGVIVPVGVQSVGASAVVGSVVWRLCAEDGVFVRISEVLAGSENKSLWDMLQHAGLVATTAITQVQMKGPSFMDASERCMQLPFVEAVRRLASPARVVEVVITVAVAAAEVTQMDLARASWHGQL